MKLSELLRALPDSLAPTARSAADADPTIRGLCIDSREVSPGDLFVALRGELADAHAWLADAAKAGAVALLVERAPDAGTGGLPPLVVVPDTRRALAPIAARFFGDPSRELQLIGVTGTNGKTSTTWLVESILRAAGRSVGLIGTVETRWASERRRSINTTPESLELQRLLRTMRTAGVEAVAMEVSSHGLAIGRVSGCRFAVGAITNLTQDHLDFHGTMEAYGDAKARLFAEFIAPGGAAVLNLDDASCERFARAAQAGGARIVGVSRDAGRAADVTLCDADVTLEGTRARLRIAKQDAPLELSLPLIGDFNLENLLVAVGVAIALELPRDAIVRGVAQVPQVPGRVERVGAELERSPTVLVDYAHTPDAVEKLLRTIRPLARERLITVFGCGGDRDRAKRPLMAQAVARFSDRAVATSDNPRTESADAILADVERGLDAMQRATPERLADTAGGYAVVRDRREAIALALSIANAEDTVVIAGKGHEDYQIIGRERLPFDDREEARRLLRLRSVR